MTTRVLAWCEAPAPAVAPTVMMQRTRHRFARIVLSLMLCHAAALTGSSLVQAATASSVSAQGCQCCCKGATKTLTCPMARAQSGGGCRLRCGSMDQPALLLGLPGVPLPTFVQAVSLTSEPLSIHVPSVFRDVILSVPDQPPRPIVSPR
jgi:hypothetical protein